MDNATIMWLIIGLALILGEFAAPGLIIIFLGFGALLTALVSALIPAFSSQIFLQIFTWAGFSILSILSLRRFFKKIFIGRQIAPHDHDYDDSARKALVIETVRADAPGRIEYQGTSWKALSFDKTYEKGQKVWILKKEGAAYYVGDPLLSEEPEE